MLTFYNVHKKPSSEEIKHSKPLRDKFKFVMIKIIEKWLSTMRKQREAWNTAQFKSYHPYYIKVKKKFYSIEVNETISDLVSKLAAIAEYNVTAAFQIEKFVIDELSDAFFELSHWKMDLFLEKVILLIETQTNEIAVACKNETDMGCLINLKKFYSLMHLPFEVNKENYEFLGFGTYLAYFSQLLANPDYLGRSRFLKTENMTAAEEEIRQYMNLVLNNLVEGQAQQMANLSILELVKFLHENSDEIHPERYAIPLQNEFGCIYYENSLFYISAWKHYIKAYFAYW